MGLRSVVGLVVLWPAVSAGTTMLWYANAGFYKAGDASTGFLDGGGSAVFQLVGVGADGQVAPPDAAGAPTGDDVLLYSEVLTFPGDLPDAYAAGLALSKSDTPANIEVFTRVFEDDAPGPGKRYFDGPVQTTLPIATVVAMNSQPDEPDELALAIPCTDDAQCEDGSVCTVDTCDDDGACVASPLNCNDVVPCTLDSCDPDTGCVHDLDDSLCTDGEDCNGVEVCHATSGCVYAAPPVDCNDDDVCTDDSCAGAVCSNVFDPSNVCDDGIPCTATDDCATGTCVGFGDACDDDNPCTTDICAPADGACTHVPNSSADCDDGDGCTVGDTCIQGACVPGPPASFCGDGDECTIDFCHPLLGCVNEPDPGAACSDGDPCTVDDQCDDQGACTSGASMVCDDADPCTDDACDPAVGCVVTHNTAACDDGLLCTVNDTCAEGACLGAAKVCDDDNVCTKDGCDPTDGACLFAPADEACDDGDACTVEDACDGGVCTGPAHDCDDGDDCTDTDCNVVEGCLFGLFEDGQACDDGSECTVDEACDQGACVGVPVLCDDGNPCTADACLPTTGCSSTPAAVPCDDGDECTTDDACDLGSGACVGGPPLDCDDDDPCTLDECDVDEGCGYVPLDGCCVDVDDCAEAGECMEVDCVDGQCMVAPMADCCTEDAECDDTAPCTADLCVDNECTSVGIPGCCDSDDDCFSGQQCTNNVCSDAGVPDDGTGDATDGDDGTDGDDAAGDTTGDTTGDDEADGAPPETEPGADTGGGAELEEVDPDADWGPCSATPYGRPPWSALGVFALLWLWSRRERWA